MSRKEPLVDGAVYHIFNRSIAGYVIFTENREYRHMLNTILYYQNSLNAMSYSTFLRRPNSDISEAFPASEQKDNYADIIAYCLMPTHYHLILRQNRPKGISKFIANVQNSYSRYFNIKHNRRGPLWEGKFRSVLVNTDEQLLHLTRYVHLNPVTAYIINNPSDWTFSSYSEYTTDTCSHSEKICVFEDCIDISGEDYIEFACDHIGYQRELGIIKHLMID